MFCIRCFGVIVSMFSGLWFDKLDGYKDRIRDQKVSDVMFIYSRIFVLFSRYVHTNVKSNTSILSMARSWSNVRVPMSNNVNSWDTCSVKIFRIFGSLLFCLMYYCCSCLFSLKSMNSCYRNINQDFDKILFCASDLLHFYILKTTLETLLYRYL